MTEYVGKLTTQLEERQKDVKRLEAQEVTRLPRLRAAGRARADRGTFSQAKHAVQQDKLMGEIARLGMSQATLRSAVQQVPARSAPVARAPGRCVGVRTATGELAEHSLRRPRIWWRA